MIIACHESDFNNEWTGVSEGDYDGDDDVNDDHD